MTKFKIDTVGIINSLIGSLIIFFVSTVYNYLFKEESFTNALINSLNLNIKLWHIIVFIGLVYFISKARKTNKDNIEPNDIGTIENATPTYLEYTEDNLLEYKWIWEWEKQKDGSYRIHKLTPLCPRDNTLMTGPELYCDYAYKCPKCTNKIYDFNLGNQARGLIKDKVYKKYKVQI